MSDNSPITKDVAFSDAIRMQKPSYSKQANNNSKNNKGDIVIWKAGNIIDELDVYCPANCDAWRLHV